MLGQQLLQFGLYRLVDQLLGTATQQLGQWIGNRVSTRQLYNVL